MKDNKRGKQGVTDIEGKVPVLECMKKRAK